MINNLNAVRNDGIFFGDYEMNRVDRVIEKLNERGLSQLLVTDPRSIFYLTGVSVEPGERFFALLVKTDGDMTLFANRLFALPHEIGIETVWLSDTDIVSDAVSGRIDAASDLGADKTTAARFLIPIQEKMAGGRTVLASDCVDWVRAVKDGDELEKMREASRINDTVMGETAAYIRAGATEKEIADYLVSRYAHYGCEGVSFEPIVSFGANAADPHHMPDGTVIGEGDCAVIDIGCRKNGYCSDMTRTFFLGKAEPEHSAVYGLVREANERAEAIVRPGVRLCDIDAAARDHIAAAGYGEYFTHRLGHFIGLEVHEYGDVSAAFKKPVEPGMCFSIEPGIYLPGKLGVRIEDLVTVTERGCEVLNGFSKDLRVL